MEPGVITAFATLLTPLGAMAGAVYWLLVRRMRALERENANLVGHILVHCAQPEDLERVAALIVKHREGDGS